MRPFQLSALLVSAGVLLSGCFVIRPSVDLAAITHAQSEEEVCDVSILAIAGEALASALLFRFTLANLEGSENDRAFHVSDEPGVALFPGAFSLFFAADALMGLGAEQDCSEAQAVWRRVKRAEAQRKQELTDLQPPATPPAPAIACAPPATMTPPTTKPTPQDRSATLAVSREEMKSHWSPSVYITEAWSSWGAEHIRVAPLYGVCPQTHGPRNPSLPCDNRPVDTNTPRAYCSMSGELP